MDYSDLQNKAKLVRKLCLEMTTAAASGHPTSCLSAADIGTVLFEKYFHYDLKNPQNIANDRFVLSKGHAAPLFYTLYALAGALKLSELQSLRQFTSRLEGHPTMHFPYTDAATGSLGQGLSVGAGLAWGIKQAMGTQTQGKIPNAYVLLGDGELAEGQIWEAANFATQYQLGNLIAIADINRLGQSQETMFGHHVEKYQKRFEAFGFATAVIEGHDFLAIDRALANASTRVKDQPLIIIAKTLKGKGISFLEDKEGWHGKALKKEELEKALKELGPVNEGLRFSLQKPSVSNMRRVSEEIIKDKHTFVLNTKEDEQMATREVYGKVLAEVGANDKEIISLDGDMKNSTFSMDFMKIYPDRFIECFIAEQNMVSVSVGLSRLGYKPYVSTFAAFLTRAADQIRMAALSQANIHFVGSHAGTSLGEDGTSQMGLEDIAMFGIIPDSVVMQPSDAISTAQTLRALMKHQGISYFRMTRPKVPLIYSVEEEFRIGGAKVLRQNNKKDCLTVAATGMTVHEALKAYELLQKEQIYIRVVDCYSIKPLDEETLKTSVYQTQQKIIITVEDHYEHGGLGDFVLSALSGESVKVIKLAVRKISHSGSKDEVFRDAGIDAQTIVDTVKKAIQ